MRIFHATQHGIGAVSSSRLWYVNLYLPLVDLGHEVIPFEYDLEPHYRNADPASPGMRAFIEENRPRLEQALLEQVRRAHRQKPIDLFFSYFYSAFCRPEVLREIGAMGICTVNWYCNASYQFHLVEEIAPAYDYCLVPEKFRLEDYRRIGANPIYCQEAANPNVYRPYDLPREFDVTFVGQKYGDRPEYIRYLLDQGIDVRAWGPGWRPPEPHYDDLGWRTRWLGRARRLTTLEGWRAVAHRLRSRPSSPPASTQAQPSDGLPDHVIGPPLDDEELIRMYSRSKISLGFSSCGDTHCSGQRILQVHLRDFEAPMSGAFYMVEHMEELEEFFEIGQEIVCYHDKEDLADKIRYYLAHDDERERIRQAGYRRAARDHSWHQRFRQVFAQIGLS